MPVDFEKSKWDRIRSNYGKWWKGELERPLISLTINDAKPEIGTPELDYRGFTSFYELSIPADKIVEAWDYELSKKEYLGDAFPAIWPNFGPGVAAAFLGADLFNGDNTVWFHPKKELEIKDIEFKYDPSNIWLKRIKDICVAGIKKWQGNVQIGMTDLGGNLDILSTFRPSEKLLFDLYDSPNEIKRLTLDAHNLWWRFFNEINSVLKPVNPGYTSWTPIFSETPSYMLQCDFSYMISPEMFDEFVRPELADSSRKLDNPFYHLDGIGELPHLDSLLKIDNLKGIQWVPGDGKPQHDSWPEVFRKIRDAGKLMQVWGDFNVLDTVVGQIGTTKGIIFFTSCDVSRKKEAVEFLKKYGAL